MDGGFSAPIHNTPVYIHHGCYYFGVSALFKSKEVLEKYKNTTQFNHAIYLSLQERIITHQIHRIPILCDWYANALDFLSQVNEKFVLSKMTATEVVKELRNIVFNDGRHSLEAYLLLEEAALTNSWAAKIIS